MDMFMLKTRKVRTREQCYICLTILFNGH